MSKYEPLWNYIKNKNEDRYVMTFSQIENVLGFTVDHSFLTFKKELVDYGYSVGKISMKDKTVCFEKTK